MSKNTKVKLSVYGGLLFVLIIIASLILQIQTIKMLIDLKHNRDLKPTWDHTAVAVAQAK